MARSSPGVGRIVSILNFFADHPGQSFTLTDLVRALKLSRATCHALLAGLVEAAYLYRSSDKSYVLGPALAAIGRIADEHFSPLQAARPEMRALADEFDVICSAVFRERDEILVRERAAAVSHLGWSLPRGVRMPLPPAFGAVFYAWSPQEEVDAWIERSAPPVTAQQQRAIFQGMAFACTHGFTFGYRKTPLKDEQEAERLYSDSEQIIADVTELDPEHLYSPAFIVAPVFDAAQRIAFVLSLVGFMHPMRGDRLGLVGRRLRATCDRITVFIGGKQP